MREILLSPLSKLEGTNGLDSAPGICRVSSGVFLPFSVIIIITYTVSGSSAAPFSLRCCERPPYDDFFALLIVVLLGVVDISFLADFSMEGLLSGRQY